MDHWPGSNRDALKIRKTVLQRFTAIKKFIPQKQAAENCRLNFLFQPEPGKELGQWDTKPVQRLAAALKPSQAEILTARYGYVKDTIGYVTEPYLVYFEAGEHDIEIESVKENMGIANLYIASKEDYKLYKDYYDDYKNETKW